MDNFKQAYQSAKKELDEEVRRKVIDEMKVFIKKTLQAIEDKKAEVAEKQQELKALKADLSDLENGKLDKIKERQDNDPVAKRVSVILVTTIINNYPAIAPYFQPYVSPWYSNTSYIVQNSSNFATNNMLYSSSDINGTYTVNCSNGEQKAFYIQNNKA